MLYAATPWYHDGVSHKSSATVAASRVPAKTHARARVAGRQRQVTQMMNAAGMNPRIPCWPLEVMKSRELAANARSSSHEGLSRATISKATATAANSATTAAASE